VPVIDDASLAALLAGGESPAPELRPVAEALAALRAGPARDELAGEAVALAAFRDRIGAPSPAHPPAHRPGRRLLAALLSARAAVAAAALSLAGFATAAYAGVLPAPVQQLAHVTIGAPAVGGAASARPHQPSGGSSPAGSAAYLLCTAWADAKAHGTSRQQAAAFGNLAAAAGGAANVSAYCAAARHPGASPSGQPRPTPTPHGSGKPSGHPTPHGSGKPSGHPTPHGSGEPSGHPTPHGSGKPSGHPTPQEHGKPTTHP
jgi:hypothetical protein